MNRKRIFWILVINVLAIIALMSVFVIGASAAPSEAQGGAAPQAGSLSVTILNEDSDASQLGKVVAYYDHNANNTNFVAGHYVGAEICASGSDISNVEATISSVDIVAYNALSLTENIFMYGKNEVLTRSLSTLSNGDCAVAYFYINTPRFKDGGTENPQSPADGMTATFTISADGLDDTPSTVSGSDDGTILIAQAISANPNAITETVTIDSGNFFTIVVSFDLGNPGGNNDATFNPTAYYLHDAGIFDLVGVHLVINNPAINLTNRLYVDGLTSNVAQGTITYRFQRVMPAADTTYYPLQVISSGTQDKYNGQVASSQVPTAITLSQIGLNSGQLSLILPLLAATLLLSATVIVLLRRRDTRQI